MDITFKACERTFNISTISKYQVALNEVVSVKDPESKNFGEKSLKNIGFYNDEVMALDRLSKYISISQENIHTFEQLVNLKKEIFLMIEQIKVMYEIN